MTKQLDTISAEEFDRRFEAGEDVNAFLDWDAASRPGLEQRRVNLDLPGWMIDRLDLEAKSIGVTRQSVMKMWLAERLRAEARAARKESAAITE